MPILTDTPATSCGFYYKIVKLLLHVCAQPQYIEHPLTLTLTSCWQAVLERLMVTKNMPSCLKTCPWARQTIRILRSASRNSKRCTRLQKKISMWSPDQQRSSPNPKRSILRSSMTTGPHRTKTNETMEIHHRTTPNHPRHTHPWHTPWLLWKSLRYTPCWV